MTKIVRAEIEASGGAKDHSARYVLLGSIAFIAVAVIIVFALR